MTPFTMIEEKLVHHIFFGILEEREAIAEVPQVNFYFVSYVVLRHGLLLT